MIILTRLNGTPFAVNADLIERVETVPDTVVTLVDGHKYVVSESADEVIQKVLAFRASILVVADHIQHQGHPVHRSSGPSPVAPTPPTTKPRLRLVTETTEV